eukprot:4188668-Pyramimonas_sp.AAC.1
MLQSVGVGDAVSTRVGANRCNISWGRICALWGLRWSWGPAQSLWVSMGRDVREGCAEFKLLGA